MMTLRFYKDEEGWFIDLPNYLNVGGSKAELKMVLGADTFLDWLTPLGDTEISLQISTNVKEIRARDEVFHDRKGWDWLQRADFIPVSEGKYYNVGPKYMWLCPVTIYVFGEYPNIIYFKRVINGSQEI